MDLNTYLLIWVCIFGLCFGSFYNVVILRSLSGESIIFPPSKCPKCGNKLKFWHNIPLLSYLILRGKCYFCHEKISIQYPLVEFITMLLFAFSFWKFGLTYTTLFVMFWLSCLLIMTATDIKEKLVDCNIAIAAEVSGIIFGWLTGGWHGALFSLLGLVAGALIMEIVARLGYLFAKTRAMGEADTYVAAALGSIFGLYGILKVLLISLAASMIFVVPVFLWNKYKSGDKGTLISAVWFIVALAVFQFAAQNYLTLALLLLTGIFLVYFLLKQMGNIGDKSYFPYVPALALAGLYAIFFIGVGI